MFTIETVSGALVPAMRAAMQSLCDAAYRGTFTADDLAHALGGTHIVVRQHSAWIAHAAVVARVVHVGERVLRAGYVEAVAVHPEVQGQAMGTEVMRAVGELIGANHDIGILSTGEHAFYERVGWEAWRGPSYVITSDGTWRRSEDEDDGIMVLRCPPTAGIDARAPIACHDRAGDAW